MGGGGGVLGRHITGTGGPQVEEAGVFCVCGDVDSLLKFKLLADTGFTQLLCLCMHAPQTCGSSLLQHPDAELRSAL